VASSAVWRCALDTLVCFQKVLTARVLQCISVWKCGNSETVHAQIKDQNFRFMRGGLDFVFSGQAGAKETRFKLWQCTVWLKACSAQGSGQSTLWSGVQGPRRSRTQRCSWYWYHQYTNKETPNPRI
jgi:hypothetical protein